MKKKIICMSCFGLIVIFFICFFMKDYEQEVYSEENDSTVKVTRGFIYEKNNKITKTQIEEKNEYEAMPSNLKGHKVIGKLEIPKINLTTYILEETTDDTLKVSVTKLEGPKINEVGNFCIIGHNYFNSRMFFKLNKVENGDEITLTDTFNESVKYKVYEVKEVLPNEVEVLNQNTQEEKEVTLITCTFGAVKRLVVKAIEIYD